MKYDTIQKVRETLDRLAPFHPTDSSQGVAQNPRLHLQLMCVGSVLQLTAPTMPERGTLWFHPGGGGFDDIQYPRRRVFFARPRDATPNAFTGERPGDEHDEIVLTRAHNSLTYSDRKSVV